MTRPSGSRSAPVSAGSARCPRWRAERTTRPPAAGAAHPHRCFTEPLMRRRDAPRARDLAIARVRVGLCARWSSCCPQQARLRAPSPGQRRPGQRRCRCRSMRLGPAHPFRRSSLGSPSSCRACARWPATAKTATWSRCCARSAMACFASEASRRTRGSRGRTRRRRARRGRRACSKPESFARLGTLAARSGWHVLLTIGLGHYEPEAAAREAAAAKAALGPWLGGDRARQRAERLRATRPALRTLDVRAVRRPGGRLSNQRSRRLRPGSLWPARTCRGRARSKAGGWARWSMRPRRC